MPRLKYRKIYDDDGEEIRDGSLVLVNGTYERILHFDAAGEIALSGLPVGETVETIEKMPDDRYREIDEGLIED